MKVCLALLLAGAAILGGCGRKDAAVQPLRLAAASSFRPVAEQIGALVQHECGVPLQFSSGSSGSLAVQVLHGAPYDVLIAAGEDVPERLARARRVHASASIGQSPLVLYAPAGIARHWDVLALARPRVAPYGAAAKQALVHMAGRPGWPGPARRVYGQSAAQAFSLAASGAAQAALAPLSLVRAAGADPAQWRAIPADWYKQVPTRALLLNARPAARCLMDVLQGRALDPVLRDAGYQRP